VSEVFLWYHRLAEKEIQNIYMLIVERKNEESIEQTIKRYRRKRRDSKLKYQLLDRKTFTKPSVKRREEVLKAIYKREKEQGEN
jgi:small subunit ribosomal protein S21